MKKRNLSVIIPTYNEMRTIGSILEVIRTWGKADEIIVVDDGSTDKTRLVVADFGKAVRLIVHKKNLGKSEAMKKGVLASRGQHVMFVDGDLLGLTHRALDALVAPAFGGAADMVVGVRGTGHALSARYKEFGGERVLRRRDLLALLPQMSNTGYGVEVILNSAYKDKQITYVLLPYVSHQIKLEKHPFGEAILSYTREALEVFPRHAWYLLTFFVSKFRR